MRRKGPYQHPLDNFLIPNFNPAKGTTQGVILRFDGFPTENPVKSRDKAKTSLKVLLNLEW